MVRGERRRLVEPLPAGAALDEAGGVEADRRRRVGVAFAVVSATGFATARRDDERRPGEVGLEVAGREVEVVRAGVLRRAAAPRPVEREAEATAPVAAATTPRAAPRAAPWTAFSSAWTCLASASIRLVMRSTSAWLAVRLTRSCTVFRCDWIAFWACAKFRSNCLLIRGGRRFWKSLTAPSAIARAWSSTPVASAFELDDARFFFDMRQPLTAVGG